MRIDRIKAVNFKGFSDIELDFDGKSTVIFGVNGMGKSSLLAIVNYIMRPLMYSLNKAQGKAYSSFTPELVKIGNGYILLAADLLCNGERVLLTRKYEKPSIRSKAKTIDSKEEYSFLMNEFFLDSVIKPNIPIFVSYGTNRSVLEVPLRIRQKHQFSQLTAIERAVENTVDFKTFFEWYRNQEDIENEAIRDIGFKMYKDKSLECVRKAIEAMLGNVTDLKVRRNPLRMTVKKDKTELIVNLLSDGEKCTLAMFGDLARRIALANPELEDPLKGEGLVLIDEIELHMHPTWQRKVLSVLKEVFPNIQFIITTHSPQVLGEADDSYNLYYLKAEDSGERIIEKINRMDGFDSNYILEEYMDTNSLNANFKKLISEANHLIDDCRFDEAEKLISQIAEISGLNSERVIEIEGALKRGRLLYEKNNKG